ncbi:MAG: hypothetical protein AAFU03_07910 [Bacteroidota bacterium]
MKKPVIILLFLGLLLISPELSAQCPMCRATAETNLANGGTEGLGLNNGILYMLGMPYIIIGTIAYFWWKNRKKEIDETKKA